MSNTPNPCSELEEQLAGPDGEDVRVRTLARLDALLLQLRRRIAGFVPREEYARLSRCEKAAQAAIDVLGGWPTGTNTEFQDPVASGPIGLLSPRHTQRI